MDELERQKRVLGMMVSMHSDLRDSYKLKSLLVEIFLLLSAVILNALVFINYDSMKIIPRETAQLYVGFFSVGVFAVSITMLLVNWKEKATWHQQAATELFKLLQEVREVMSDQSQNTNPIVLKGLIDKYKQVNSIVIPIPENRFNRLKARHLRKIEFSKFITNNPAFPYWILKAKFFFYSLKQNNGKK